LRFLKELRVDRPTLFQFNVLVRKKLALYRDFKRESAVLMGTHCPHRGADMTFGRIEDDGIFVVRFPLVGSLMKQVSCINQPAEQKDS